MALFPNVPNVPGVPALPRDPLALAIEVALLVADAFGIFSGEQSPWGIFRDGFRVVAAETVVSFDFRRSWAVADFPLERGAFESYDKVEMPFDARVRFAAGGDIQARQALLDSIAAIAGTLDLFDVVTPEVVYTDVNVVHYDYRRTSDRGVGMITVDVWLIEVRETATAQFTSTKSPAAASPQNGGTVQPVDPTPFEQSQTGLVE